MEGSIIFKIMIVVHVKLSYRQCEVFKHEFLTTKQIFLTNHVSVLSRGGGTPIVA